MTIPIMSARNLLVINPNSTESMTAALRPLVESLGYEQTAYHYFQPESGPPSINSDQDAHESATESWKDLRDIVEKKFFDGYLIACYSAHPLVSLLRSQTDKPVVGIFEASISVALQYLDSLQVHRFGIVSTGKVWERLLTDGVMRFLQTPGFDQKVASERFAGVETTGLNATELHDAPQEEVEIKMKQATTRLIQKAEGNVKVICLGCAGMVGMETWVREACTGALGQQMASKIRIIDGVKAGIIMLEGLARAKF